MISKAIEMESSVRGYYILQENFTYVKFNITCIPETIK